MINLYVRDISPLFDGAWAGHLSLLPAERGAQARRFRRDHDAARCVGSWLLLRDALARESIAIDRLALKTGAYGKPFFDGGPEFSISHAGPYAAVAVSDEPVGVDIEAPRCTIHIARHVFSPREYAAAAALSGEAQRTYLQRLWVAKEAFVKAIGTGLSTPFRSFSVALDGPSVELTQELTALPIRITEFSVEAYRIAVAGVGAVLRRDL